MNATSLMPPVSGDSTALASGDGIGSALARFVPARWMHRLLDRLDDAFDFGRIEGRLPDGSVRIIGGRGPGPSAQIDVASWAAIVALMLSGSVGWFRAWMAGQWRSDDVVTLIAAFSANRVKLAAQGRARGPVRAMQRLHHWLRHNSRSGARRNIHAHYDLGNDFYAAWLDPSMTYSSALFDAAQPDEPLHNAQLRKMDALLARLDLKAGDCLLEIGCGWGALGARAIARHGVDYVGLTISNAQAGWAADRLGPSGAIVVQDYRDHRAQYDAIASVEMVEAVGQRYWPDFLDAVAGNLRPGGHAALQFIAIDDAVFEQYASGADFIQRYIFPGGCLISISRFRALAAERGLNWTDQHDFPLDYARTLRRWRDSFDARAADGSLPEGFDDHFVRMWRYYLMYCEAGFLGGSIIVAQVTLVKSSDE